MSSISVWIFELANAAGDSCCASILSTGCPRRQTFRMDMLLSGGRLIELFAQGMLESNAPHMYDFGNDRNGDFFRQDSADIQADRHIHALDALARNAFTLQLFGNRADFALAADHADVACLGLNGPSQHVLIFLVAARDD